MKSPRQILAALLVCASAGFVSASTNCTPPPPGLSAWWPGEGTAQDVTGNYFGAPENGPAYSAGKAGQAFQFSGSDRIRFSSLFPFHQEGDVTMALWLNSAATSAQSVFWTRNDDTDRNRFNISVNAGNNFVLDYRSADGALHTGVGAVVPANTWNHIVISRTANTYAIYTNGLWAASWTDASPSLPTTVGWQISGRGPYMFRGGLDELTFFNRALDSNEIAALAAAGSDGLCPVLSFSAGDGFTLDSSNPNGAWSYGWMPADFSQFNLYVNRSTVNYPHWYGWGGDWTPGIWKNLGAPVNGVPTGWLSLHPGDGAQPCVLRWTAPAAGSARVTGQFLPGDSGAMQVAVRRNGQGWWSAADAGAFDLATDIGAGGTIDFAVYGGYSAGNTPLEASISLDLIPAPAISVQPTNQEIWFPRDVTFLVEATGAMPLWSQWYHEESPLAGATNLALVLPAAGASNAGRYFVVITNHAGAVTSQVATLTVKTCRDALAGLISWWPGDNSAADLGGNHAGSLQNGASYAPGKVGLAFSFDGVDDYVSVGNWAPGATWTLGAWVKPSTAADGRRRTIIGGVADCRDWAIGLQANEFGVVMRQPGGCTQTISSGVTPVPGEWYYVVCSCDGATARVYINGELRGAGAVDPNYIGTTSGVRIGGEACCAGNNFPGLVDEVIVFGRALSAAEVAAIYAAGSVGLCKPTPPAIVQSPAATLAEAYRDAALEVLATGTPPLSYQWHFSGAPVPGATNATLSLPLITTNQAGPYFVTVANDYGRATSQVAVITVLPDDQGPAVLSLQPAGWVTHDVSRLLVEFDERIATNTFTGDDVAIIGPAGFISAAGIVIQPAPSGNGRVFEILIPVQTAEGVYRVKIGPDIADLSGNTMSGSAGFPQPLPETGSFQFLPNGDFESGDVASWVDESGSKGVWRASTNMVFTGRYAAEAHPSIAFNGAGFALDQWVSVAPGADYVFSAFFHSRDLSSGSLYLDLGDISWYNGGDVEFHVPLGVPHWQFSSISFRTPDWINSVRVRLCRDGEVKTGEFCQIDGVALTPASQFRQPELVGHYESQFTIDKTGPRVLSVSPTVASNAVSFVDVQFDSPVAAATFTPADVTLDCPSAAGVSSVEPLSTNLFRVRFSLPLTQPSCQITLGTNLTDLAANFMTSAFTAALQIVLPDLAITSLTAPGSAQGGHPVSLFWTVTNQGSGIVSRSWQTRLALATDAAGANPQTLGTFTLTNLFDAGASLVQTGAVIMPAGIAGNRWLVVTLDSANEVVEVSETNNVLIAAAPIELLAPDLSMDLVTVEPSSAQFSQSVDVTWVVRNAGNGPASSNWNDVVTLSLDAFPGNDIPLWTNAPHGALALGQSYTNTARVVLPLSSTLLAGAYSILVTADPANLQPESTKANNVRAAGITIAMPPLPDLVVSEIRLPASAPIGQPASVSWVISNQGPAQASGVWTETVAIALNPAGDGLQSLGAFTVTNTLDAGASVTRTQMVALPAGVFGNRYVVVAADTANRVIEELETNNAATSGAALVIRAADLVVDYVTVAAGAQFGRPADVTWTVRNRGGAPAVAPWTDRLFFSGAPALATARPLSPAGAVRTLAAGASYTNTQSVILPLDHALAAGGFYLLATADADNAVLEENELDNTTASVVVPVAYPPLPDLTVTNVHGPAGAVAGLPTPVTWAVTNRGAALANGAWNERLFACDDTNGSNPQLLATFSFTSRILPGDGLIRTQRVMLPVEWRGARYFKAQIDCDDALFETTESNNTAVALQPSMISAPDLQVVSVSASPASAQFGQQVRVTWVVQNTGEGPASSSWSDRLVFSSSGGWGGGAILTTQPADSMLEPGQSYTNFVMATLPLTAGSAPGTWHLMVMADIHNVLAETVETNNVTGTPIAMGFPPLPDLAVRDVALFDTNGLPAAHVLPGQPAILVWTTTNAGSLAAAGSWVEAFTVTTNESGAGGVSAGVLTATNPLPAGGFLIHTQAVTIPLNSPTGRGYWVVSADAQNVLIESDEANNSGVAAAASDVSAVLSLQLASQNLYEGASIAATVSRNGDRTAPLTVLVTGSDPAQMYSPASVVIPAGQGSVSFNLVGVADGLLDGNRMVLVGVSADGFGPAQASLTVMDTDVPKLMLAFEASTLTEGRTVAATVSVMPAPARDQSISVFSSRASRLLVPATVTLLAGQTNVTFAVLAVDNVAVELPVSATVSVTASGYAASAGTLTILDNDAPELSLVLDRSSVSEAGGPSAAYATLLNARTNGAPLVLFLEASIPELVRLPSSVTLPANSTRVSFAVGVVDDLLTNGPRTVSVRAYPTTTYGNTRLGASAGAMLLVNDNEGPTLQLAFDREILSAADHSPVQGRVIRSGPLDAPLTVSLVSGDLARLTASGTVIIPAGQSNATVTVTTVDDHALRGSASVTLTASAPGCNDGSARLVVTHDLLPDLVITELSAPAVVTGGDVASVSFRVANTGLAPAVGSWVQQVFLSTNPVYDATATLLGQFPFTGSLSAGQTIGQALSFYAPSQPGQYYVIAMADSTNDIVEVLEDNNLQISAQPVTVAPNFTATVQCDFDLGMVGMPVPLHGTARRASLVPVAYEVINIYVQLYNTTRILTVLTDDKGAFTATFNPLQGEGGSYTISAAMPGAVIPPAQDSFILAGMASSENPLARRFNGLSGASGQFQLRNLSDVALSGLTAQVQGLPSGLQATVALQQTDLAGSGAVTVQFELRSLRDETASSAFSILFRSAEGAQLELPVYVMVDALLPRLAVTPSSFQLGLVRGQQRLEMIQVVNTGGAPSEPLALSLPDLPWMSVASTNPIPGLAPGETNQFLVQFTPPPEQPLSEFNGSFAVAGGSVSANIPFHIKVVSSSMGNLKLVTVDEATYYGVNQTNFGGVSLVLRDPFSNQIVAQGHSGADGILWFADLREGTYNLEASAPKHDTTTMTVAVKPGVDTEITVFLRTQLVRYFWNVEEIEIEDHYKITIDTVFETVVPTPVVTVSPTMLDLATVEGDEGQFMLSMTNHGLVAANNVKIRFDTHPDWILTPLVSDVGVLPARSGLSIPVTARRVGAAGPSGARAKSGGAACVISAGVDWLLLCGPFGITYNVPILVINASGDCTSISSPGTGGGGPGVWTGWGPGPSGGSSTGPSFSPVTPSYASSNSCACDPSTFTPKCVNGETGIDANLDAAINAVKAAMPPWAKLTSLKLTLGLSGQICDCCENSVRGIKASASGGVNGEAVVVIGFSGDIPDMEADVDTLGKVVMKASVMAGVEIKATGGLNATVETECFLNNPKACVTGSIGASGFVGVKGNATFSANYNNQVVSTVADAVAGVQAGFTISVSGCNDGKGIVAKVCAEDVVLKFTATGTLKYKVGNTELSTGVTLGTNMVLQKGGCWPASPIPVPFGDELTSDKIAQMLGFPTAHAMAAAQAGVSSPQALAAKSPRRPVYSYAWSAPRPAGPPAPAPVVPAGAVNHSKKSGEGVCAQVRLQLDQQASLTRKALAATLEVVNDSDTAPLDELVVSVSIYDPEGNLANDKFLILPPTLTDITDLTPGTPDSTNITVSTSAWHVDPATTGKARWVILPLDTAAPETPVVYRVGGFMSYTAGGVPGSATFTPAPVTVYPNARLALDYFHQRDVFSDDPFTPEVEPSVPYSLAVMAHNIGRGQAKNFKITSAQPKIVENLKGLLIDFKIIATEVSGQALSPGLTANFGAIDPGQIKIARWLMKSSLQGLFVEYSATFEHEDALGGKATSLIDHVSIHEMNRLVYAGGAFSDGLPDFLVHDSTNSDNILDLPDTLYLSDGSTNAVSVVTNALLDNVPSPGQLTVHMTAVVPSGWTYLRVPEPSDSTLILRRVLRSDGAEIPVETNAWITDRTFIGMGKPPIRQNILHLLDFDSTGQYTLVYEEPPVPDTAPPSSQVAVLPASSAPQIPLSWSGSDDNSGVAAFDVYVSVNGGPFLAWLSQTPRNSAVYSGQAGYHYAFYSVATDNAGNRESPHSSADAETTVDRTNHAPVFRAVSSQAIDEGTTLSLEVAATDVDSDTLAYTLLSGPSGMQYDPVTGRLTWATSEASGPSSNWVTVVVTDNGAPPFSATNGFAVVVREVNSAPSLGAISNRRVNEGHTLTFVCQATDNDVPAQTLAFSLGAGAPAGAAINPATGVFQWKPSATQGGTNYSLSVIVTDNGTPALSATQSFLVTVRDIVADVAVHVGSTNLYVGETNAVPFTLASGLDLQQIAFTLRQDPVRLQGYTVTDLPVEIQTAEISAVKSNESRITFTARTNQTLQGLIALGRLRFGTDTNPRSAVVSLAASNLLATRGDGSLFDRGLGGIGRVFVVGAEPVLDISRDGTVRLYGRTGLPYELLSASQMRSTPAWTVVRRFTLDGRFADVSGALTNTPGLFYGARQVAVERLGILQNQAGVFRLDLKGAVGGSYRIETKTTMPAEWAPVISFTLSNSMKSIDWTNHGESVRYFRAVRQ